MTSLRLGPALPALSAQSSCIHDISGIVHSTHTKQMYCLLGPADHGARMPNLLRLNHVRPRYCGFTIHLQPIICNLHETDALSDSQSRPDLSFPVVVIFTFAEAL